MLKYNILRWDPVLHNNTQVPLITIKPDQSFLTFAKANKFKVFCEITIDGVTRTSEGVVNSSADVPNCRPNYFEKTGNYVITLIKKWKEYPKSKNLGTITFSSVSEGETTKKNILSKSIQKYNKAEKLKNCDGKECVDIHYTGPCKCGVRTVQTSTTWTQSFFRLIGIIILLSIVIFSDWNEYNIGDAYGNLNLIG